MSRRPGLNPWTRPTPRSGLLLRLAPCCLALLLAVPAGRAADDSPPGPAAAAAAPPPAAAAPEEIDRQPYRIQAHFFFDPSARFDRARRAGLLKSWRELVGRFVGPPWIVSIASPPSPIAGGDLETVDAEAFARLDPSFDKLWLIRVSAADSGAGLDLSGRAYDTATRQTGPFQRRRCPLVADAPRELLRFCLDLFSPTALITGQEGGRALLRVRGAAITPASEQGRVVHQGTVFQPLRLVTMPDNSVIVRRIAFTYLQVEAINGPIARCAIVSGLRDPLTQRVSRPNTLAALGLTPGNSALSLQFVTRPDLSPAAGYTLTARAVPDGVPQELGMTDRSGKIVLKPGFARGLVILRLLAGNAEPMVEFPIMPGEGHDHRPIPIDPKPLTVAYQVKLDALRDEVIDLVAQRARLEKRMEARLQGEDLAGLEQCLKEYALLPRREVHAEHLAALKDQAARQQAESKTAVLTKNIQARFNELQALIDRYLSDEAVSSYTEALQHKKAELAEAARARTKAQSARSAPAAGAPRGEAAKPAPARKEAESPTQPF